MSQFGSYVTFASLPMPERGKYSSILSEIRQEQAIPDEKTLTVFVLPAKPPSPAGKRSAPRSFRRVSFSKREGVATASERLRARGDKTDFPDLMQALLEAWLASSS